MKIGVFYHCRLMGGDPPIDMEHATNIMVEQMLALKIHFLDDAASFILCGINGDGMEMLEEVAPKKAIIQNYVDGRGELPTLNLLAEWCKQNPDAIVLYHHTKGAIHKGETMYDDWRTCMERHLVFNWKNCVEELKTVESVGCHWMSPEKYPQYVKAPFWGGNFWWARASFINTLPPLRKNAENRQQFYDAESWIGWGPRRPTIIDHHPAWPGAICSTS